MREITYLEAINEALTEEMARDEKVFIMGEDIGMGLEEVFLGRPEVFWKNLDPKG